MTAALWLLLLGAAHSSPRAVAAPPSEWSDLSDRKVVHRLWWEGGPAEVWVERGGGWRSQGIQEPGWVSRPLSPGTRFRVEQGEGSSEPFAAPPWTSPAELAALAGPRQAWLGGVVGQIRADGELAWASTLGGGLLRIEGSSVTPLLRWDGLPSDWAVAVDAAEGRVLVGTDLGAVLLQDARPVQVWDSVLPDPYVQAVLLDDEPWLGTYQGLYHAGEVPLAPWSVFSISPSQLGPPWVGYEGLRRPGLAAAELDGVHVMDALDENGLWLATQEHGVLIPFDDGWLPLRTLPKVPAWQLALQGDVLWAALGEHGLVSTTGVALGWEQGLGSHSAWSVEAVGQGLLVGTDAGLVRVEGAQVTAALPVSRWPGGGLDRGLVLRRKGAWVATRGTLSSVGGPRRHSGDLIVAARPPVVAVVDVGRSTWAVGKEAIELDRRGDLHRVGLPGVMAAAVEHDGQLWVGGSGGVWRFDPVADAFVQASHLPDVTRLVSWQGELWVVSDGLVVRLSDARPYMRLRDAHDVAPVPGSTYVGTVAGLQRLFPESGEVVEVRPGAPVTAVTADGAGGCWYATDDGVVGHLGASGGSREVRVPHGSNPTELVADGDHVWLLTEAGTWRVRLPAE